jgi:hypothetical protein
MAVEEAAVGRARKSGNKQGRKPSESDQEERREEE